MNNIEKLCDCFQEMGIMVNELNESVELFEIIEDSMNFITFIVELENTYKIEIPDEYLLPGNLVTIKDVLQMIDKLQSDVISSKL